MVRICAVIGCSNSTLKLDRWYSQLCEIHGVFFGSCVCTPPFHLFPFPTERKDPERRKRWTKLMNRKTKGGRNWQPSYVDRVCSVHFRESEPTASFPDPTEKLGYDILNSTFALKKMSLRKPPKRRLTYSNVTNGKLKRRDVAKIPAETNSAEKTNETDKSEIVTETMEEDCKGQDLSEGVQSPPKKKHYDHDYVNMNGNECVGCFKNERKLKDMKRKLKKVEQSLKSMHTKKTGHNVCDKVLKSDATTRHFTGLVTKSQFYALYSYLEPKVATMRYWTGSKKESTPKSILKGKRKGKKTGPSRILSTKEEFILVLMKLKMALTSLFLGSLFNISSSTASQVFNTWIKFLSRELSPLIFWPDKLTILQHMPESMKKKYQSLRCTLDCTEIFIGRPRNLELQALTCSDYKKHNTIKFLVAIAPNGMITFISKSWGGRASDVHITRESGFLDLVDPGDVILADRGFTIIEDLMLRQAKLEIPPPSKGREQQTPEEVTKTKKVANARIHVERAIGRMKWFGILRGTLPITFIPLADDIITVCAALVNLRPPLVSK